MATTMEAAMFIIFNTCMCVHMCVYACVWELPHPLSPQPPTHLPPGGTPHNQ